MLDVTCVLQRLHDLSSSQGNTVVVLEHKLELLPLADWIVEFGPGGGPAGGRVIFQGTAVELAKAATPTASAWKNRTHKPVKPNKRPALAVTNNITVSYKLLTLPTNRKVEIQGVHITSKKIKNNVHEKGMKC